MLTAAEIASMRVTAASVFDDTAVISTYADETTAAGSSTERWTPAGTVPCHLSPITRRGEREPVEGERVSARSEWILTVPTGTVIAETSRVTVGERQFEVATVLAPRTWELARRVEMIEVK